MDRFCSDQAFLGITGDDSCLRLENWFLGNGGRELRARLSAASTNFTVRDYDFRLAPAAFPSFLESVKRLYAELAGTAVLTGIAGDRVTIDAVRAGHFTVYCRLRSDHPVPQQVEIGFDLDQTYFQGFIGSLEAVRARLGL